MVYLYILFFFEFSNVSTFRGNIGEFKAKPIAITITIYLKDKTGGGGGGVFVPSPMYQHPEAISESLPWARINFGAVRLFVISIRFNWPPIRRRLFPPYLGLSSRHHWVITVNRVVRVRIEKLGK